MITCTQFIHDCKLTNALLRIYRPIIVIAGGYDTDQSGMGAFQEWPQVSNLSLYISVISLCILHIMDHYRLRLVGLM